MSEAALLKFVDKLLSSDYDPVSVIVDGERERGFVVVRPGDTPWFRANDWRVASVASINGKCARLILLHAFESNQGTFKRTLAAIALAGLTPVVVEPTPEFSQSLKRIGWKRRSTGSTFDDRETVWYPVSRKPRP